MRVDVTICLRSTDPLISIGNLASFFLHKIHVAFPVALPCFIVFHSGNL